MCVDIATKYTMHTYILIQEKNRPERDEKSLKILYLANLTLLLIQIMELSAEWSMKSHEERSLDLINIDLMFPSNFLYPEMSPAASEAGIVLALRTQIFVQMFLENLHEGIGEWALEDKQKEIFFKGSNVEEELRVLQSKDKSKLSDEEKVSRFMRKGIICSIKLFGIDVRIFERRMFVPLSSGDVY